MYRLFLGSYTYYVLLETKITLHVYKKIEVWLENKILVPLDCTDVNLDLIKTPHEWAQKEDAKVVFLHFGELHEYARSDYMMVSCFFKKQDDELINEMDSQEHDAEVAEVKNELNKYLRLIMLAAHSHTVIGSMWMRCNTDYLVYLVKCSLYVHDAVEWSASV